MGCRDHRRRRRWSDSGRRRSRRRALGFEEEKEEEKSYKWNKTENSRRQGTKSDTGEQSTLGPRKLGFGDQVGPPDL